MKDLTTLAKIIERFKEPSTWATISVILLGFKIAGPDVDRYVEIGLNIATLASVFLGIFLPEGKGPKGEPGKDGIDAV